MSECGLGTQDPKGMPARRKGPLASDLENMLGLTCGEFAASACDSLALDAFLLAVRPLRLQQQLRPAKQTCLGEAVQWSKYMETILGEYAGCS